MGRIGEAFERARKEGRCALVVYLCAGDPDLATTPRLVAAAADAGADVVELGMPFSDPTADGPVIQRASERALAAGTTMRGLLDTVRRTRAAGTDVPLLLFGYYNPILAYGEAALARDAAAAGIDGLLVVDLPPEECGSLRSAAEAQGLDYVPLVAPTSSAARVDRVASVASGFVYYVSLTGVTGAGGADLDGAARRARTVADHTGKPVAVGFGVSSPDDVVKVAAHADGVVVGSAIVRSVEQAGDPAAAVKAVSERVTALASATSRRVE